MVFFFQAEDGIRDRTVTGVQTCALPISAAERGWGLVGPPKVELFVGHELRKGDLEVEASLVQGKEKVAPAAVAQAAEAGHRDRKSTRLNSSHRTISYAVFCLKKKKLV